MAVTRFLGVLTLLLVCAGGACASVARTFSDVAGGDDTAPEDGAASWRFSPDAVPLSLAASFTSSAPRHGRAFALVHVSASFSDGTRGFAPATCTAKLGRTALRPGCHWRAPAKARGLRLAIVVRAAGLRRAYSFRVR